MFVCLIVLVIALGMMLVEMKNPARKWPEVTGWWLRTLCLNACQIFFVWLAGVVWDEWMLEHRLWSADWLGVLGGTVIGYFAITFADYWWHRFRHDCPFLWRWLHQVHHSAQRIEVATAFYRSPLEILVSSILVGILLYLVLGLGVEAATYTLLVASIVQMFYHWNIATPYWLGYIVQRPESHCLHHQDGLHTYNFSDLPLWDMLFGTFVNPKKFAARCGFGQSEHRLVEMLVGIDVQKNENGVKKHSPAGSSLGNADSNGGKEVKNV